VLNPDKDADAETALDPAPFPDELARDHIISWSNEGDVVLDPFSGSGTTARMGTVMSYTAYLQ
jgi:DNA modification methylase